MRVASRVSDALTSWTLGKGGPVMLTPIVRSPVGSARLASWMASEVARSVLAAETARMMAFGFLVYCITSRTSCASMS